MKIQDIFTADELALIDSGNYKPGRAELDAKLDLAMAIEREANAKMAGRLWQQFQDTKDAHERNTMESFKPDRFGFNLFAVQQSQQMMDAIRARGNT